MRGRLRLVLQDNRRVIPLARANGSVYNIKLDKFNQWESHLK